MWKNSNSVAFRVTVVFKLHFFLIMQKSLESAWCESNLLANFRARFPFFDQISTFLALEKCVIMARFDRKQNEGKRIDVWFTFLICSTERNENISFLESRDDNSGFLLISLGLVTLTVHKSVRRLLL